MVFLTMFAVFATHIHADVHVPTNAEPIGAHNMTHAWPWLIYVACFAVVLAVADMNLDKALGL